MKCCIKTGRDFVCSSSISSFLRHWNPKTFLKILFRSFMRTCAHSAVTLHCAAEHFLLSSSPTPYPCWGARWGQGQEVCVSWGARRGGRWGGRFDCRARAGEAQRWETGINNAAPQEGARSVWVNPLLGGRDCPSADGSLRGFVHQLFNRERFFFASTANATFYHAVLQPFAAALSLRFQPWNPSRTSWRPPVAGAFSGS